ncbi:MAG: hypothetical protein CVU32_00795 [Betaproteobacteria bacterium HGW-Betaproteobacteria-5]|jgi:hypothetical protein|nr:MAG: hypothetical protein CVU32_00795 [Betaproteobacteria bacterium HGW-Betaproteobacteria-5]PKO40743.1 MAG: hypothetical protein CVU33_01885 [Betaproteobacteria bacterium HGW-Betaproteobacteria-6]PKO90802.1 MAG: hypothetical protein CVU16_09070 [Betaproteobacteria bacterium HGW-Betaproteobacteria-10]
MPVTIMTKRSDQRLLTWTALPSGIVHHKFTTTQELQGIAGNDSYHIFTALSAKHGRITQKPSPLFRLQAIDF